MQTLYTPTSHTPSGFGKAPCVRVNSVTHTSAVQLQTLHMAQSQIHTADFSGCATNKHSYTTHRQSPKHCLILLHQVHQEQCAANNIIHNVCIQVVHKCTRTPTALAMYVARKQVHQKWCVQLKPKLKCTTTGETSKNTSVLEPVGAARNQGHQKQCVQTAHMYVARTQVYEFQCT